MTGYVWIAPLMRLLELRYGPFWEPARPYPLASANDVLDAAAELEPLLQRVVVGRLRALAIFWGLVLATILTLIAAISLRSSTLMIVGTGLLVVASASRWAMSPRWFTYYDFVVGPTAPAPAPTELVAQLRLLCDRLIGAGELAPAALVEMQARAPLSYEAAMKLTVTTSVMRKAARAAQQAHRADAVS